MDNGKGKKYCVVDHANKQKDLAHWTPYEFWLNQVKRGHAEESETATAKKPVYGSRP